MKVKIQIALIFLGLCFVLLTGVGCTAQPNDNNQYGTNECLSMITKDVPTSDSNKMGARIEIDYKFEKNSPKIKAVRILPEQAPGYVFSGDLKLWVRNEKEIEVVCNGYYVKAENGEDGMELDLSIGEQTKVQMNSSLLGVTYTNKYCYFNTVIFFDMEKE